MDGLGGVGWVDRFGVVWFMIILYCWFGQRSGVVRLGGMGGCVGRDVLFWGDDDVGVGIGGLGIVGGGTERVVGWAVLV